MSHNQKIRDLLVVRFANTESKLEKLSLSEVHLDLVKLGGIGIDIKYDLNVSEHHFDQVDVRSLLRKLNLIREALEVY